LTAAQRSLSKEIVSLELTVATVQGAPKSQQLSRVYLKPLPFKWQAVGFKPRSMPIEGTEVLIRAWPKWFSEDFGITPKSVLSLVHRLHKTVGGLSFRENPRVQELRVAFNSKKLNPQQRRRLWFELILWQELLVKQLATKDPRNVLYQQWLNTPDKVFFTYKSGKRVRMDRHQASRRMAQHPWRYTAKATTA